MTLRHGLGLLAAGAVLAACSSTASTAPPSSTTSVSGNVTVFAASSLQESFTALAKTFEAEHPGVTVTLSFGASDGLATQIVQGAPADVFASASPKTMATVTSAHDAGTPTPFATNQLEVATPPSNPAAVHSLSDLAHPGIKVATCQPAAPCGEAATKLFAKNHLTVTPATLGQDVKAVLTLVELGEVDAGVVYVTDVDAAGGKVHGVRIEKADNVTSLYPISTLTGSTNKSAAKSFVDLVLSPAGQSVLRRAGFGPA